MTSDYKEIQDKIAFQSENKISCEIVNPDHAGINPPAIYTSQDVEFPEHLNKLMITITNSGEKPLSLLPWPVDIKTGIGQVQSLDRLSYLRLDLSDFVNDEFQSMIKPSYQAEGLSARFVRISKSLEQIGKYRELDPSDITEKSVWILKIIKSEQSFNKLEKFVFNKGDAISVLLESVVSTVRPSLRYLDTSWVNPVNISDRVLVQNTVVLKRPSYFVGRPFPLEIFWLNNHNIAYISNGENYPAYEFENELSFAISNKGLKPLRTDCREEVLESPYFELVFLGGSGTGDTTYEQYVKDIQLEIKDDSYGDEWTHHKMIQGPNVTWRIQPRLYVDGERNKSILGIEEKGTITFTIKDLKVVGDPGVSMLYLKYYNIPDFDDNQIVLYIEKKELKGAYPRAGFEPKDLLIDSKTNETVTPPLRWDFKQIKGENDTIKNETTVILGDKVGVGTENPEKELHVKGDTLLDGNLNIQKGNQKNANLRVRDGSIIPMEGSGPNTGIQFNQNAFGGSNHSAFLEYYRSSGKKDTTLKIANNKDSNNNIVLDPGNGNVGIGADDPKAKLDIESNPRIHLRHKPHPRSVNGLYVTGDFEADSKGVEFRNSRGSQGIGFGYNTLYATGNDTNQDLNIKAKGNGKVGIIGDLKVDGSISASNFKGIKLNWGEIKTTEFVNSWDGVLDWKASNETVIVGLYSEHNNNKEDRRWKIYYRKLSLSVITE